jgi:hypothetical protein
MKNVSIRFVKDNENKEVLGIELKGDLNIENACIIKNELLKNIKSKTIFNLFITDITAFDLAFYQLLVSFKLTLDQQNKTLNLKMDTDDENVSLLLKSGFDLNFN